MSTQWTPQSAKQAAVTGLVVQVLPGGHGARTYQDERFSYVILRRGPRPAGESVPEVSVARQRQVDAPDAVQQAIDAGMQETRQKRNDYAARRSVKGSLA